MQNEKGYIRQENELFQSCITNFIEIAPDVFVLSFKKKYEFLPGQAIKLAIDFDHPARIYSICSGDFEKEIRILFNIKEDGYLTPRLATMVRGDKILVSKPYGSFIGSKDPAWWIATGTGIAPFYCMFQSGLWENKTLIHGARYLNQFYFEDDLDWALGKNYIRCCSGEQRGDVFPGRVTDYLKSIADLPLGIKYYLCGKALMVVETRDLLIARGIPFENIIAEIYF